MDFLIGTAGSPLGGCAAAGVPTVLSAAWISLKGGGSSPGGGVFLPTWGATFSGGSSRSLFLSGGFEPEAPIGSSFFEREKQNRGAPPANTTDGQRMQV